MLCYTQLSLKFIDNIKIILVHLIFQNPFSSLSLNCHLLFHKHSWMCHQYQSIFFFWRRYISPLKLASGRIEPKTSRRIILQSTKSTPQEQSKCGLISLKFSFFNDHFMSFQVFFFIPSKKNIFCFFLPLCVWKMFFHYHLFHVFLRF